MRESLIQRLAVPALVFALGLAFLALGYNLAQKPDTQAEYFNAGIKAMKADRGEIALELFQQSIAAYQSDKQSNWFERFFYPPTDLELAALAYGHMGDILLLKVHNRQQATLAYKEALRTYSGVEAVPGISRVDTPTTAQRTCSPLEPSLVDEDMNPVIKGDEAVCRYVRMQQETLNWKTNIDLLAADGGADQSKEGQGKRNKKKQGKDMSKPLPGLAPGGKGDSHLNPDDI